MFFIAKENGELSIGDNIGMSSTAIICDKFIQIGDLVKIDGNVIFYMILIFIHWMLIKERKV